MRILKRSYGFIATALCVAMTSSSFAKSEDNQTLAKEEIAEQITTAITKFLNNSNNGNGNASNPSPGAETESIDDGNNGHGNDPSGSDPSNPGKGKDKDSNEPSGNETTITVILPDPEPPQSGSVTELLGIKEAVTGGPPESTGNPLIVPPTTTTNNPFDDISPNGGNGFGSPDDEIVTLPFGSVPLIRDDAASIDYMLDSLLEDAAATNQANGEELEMTPEMRESYEKYARKLVKTLSKLSQKQQEYIFYGVTG